jgi:sugar/nucleoside kinase (ribokinase family)
MALSRSTADTTEAAPLRAPRRLLTCGYVVLDVIARDAVIGHSAGGTAGNVAANSAWLGMPSAVIARLGADSAGRRVIGDLAAVGTSVEYVTIDQHASTPLVVHQVTDAGHHKYLFSCPICRRPFPRYRPPHPQDAIAAVAAFKPTDFFCDRVSAATLAASTAAHENGAAVFFEPNRIGRLEWARATAATAHVLKVSGHAERDVQLLVESPRPSQLQIISLGADGLKWRLGDRRWRDEPPISGRVADAGGSGDWLTAALLTQLGSAAVATATMNEIRDGIRFGQALATLGCAYVGARGLARAVTAAEAKRSARRLLEATHDGFDVHPLASYRKRARRDDCRACLRPVAA